MQRGDSGFAELTVEQFDPYPDVASALRRCAPAVGQAWLRRLRELVPKVAAMADAEALDDLPDALRVLADALAGEFDGRRRLSLIGPTHGLTRFHQGFSATDFAKEYPVLRHELVAHLRREVGRDLLFGESDALHFMVDRLIQLAGAAFTTLQEKEIRLENEATGRHLAMMSHDLRNTLNAAMLSLEMVRERMRELEADGPPDLPELLADMDDCRRLAMGAVDSMTRLLEAERLRVGQVPLAVQAVDLCGLLKSVRTASARAMGLRHMEVADGEPDSRIEIECNPGTVVHTDPDLLSTILQNLLGNAIRYAGQAPIRMVGCRAGSHRPETNACTVQVIDRGPGIEQEQLQTIFGLFRRGTSIPVITQNQKRDGAPAGTGLGLFISRRAAELLGAKLEVESKVGEGTTFTLTLPAQPPKPR